MTLLANHLYSTSAKLSRALRTNFLPLPTKADCSLAQCSSPYSSVIHENTVSVLVGIFPPDDVSNKGSQEGNARECVLVRRWRACFMGFVTVSPIFSPSRGEKNCEDLVEVGSFQSFFSLLRSSFRHPSPRYQLEPAGLEDRCRLQCRGRHDEPLYRIH